MRRIFLFFLVLVLSLSASVYKGQKEYMKKCKRCHGLGSKLSLKYTQSEWKLFFNNQGKKLITVHEKSDAREYFHSSRFEKKIKHLKDFFLKFAADSGNVPACSD